MPEFVPRSGPAYSSAHGGATTRGDHRPEPQPPAPPAAQLASRVARDLDALDLIDAQIAGLAAPEAATHTAPQRRLAYDRTRTGIDAAIDAASTRLAAHRLYAREHQVSEESASVDGLATKLDAVRATLTAAPPPPPRFDPVAGEASITALVQRRATGPSERQAQAAEIATHFGGLTPVERRRLLTRIGAPDPEDALARAFAGLIEWGPALRGVLAGTHRIRIEAPRTTPGPAPDMAAGTAPADAAPRPDDGAPAADTAGDHAAQVAPPVADDGGPAPLPHRATMERVFQQSFADVQVTTDASLAAHGIRGVAEGNRVAFAAPDPAPALVAHELAHVAQQRRAGASAPAPADESQPTDAAEIEARAIAAQVGAGDLSPVAVQARPVAAAQYDRDSTTAPRDDAPHSALAYFDRNLSLILAQIRQRISAAAWPLGHARVAWLADPVHVATAVTDRLLVLTGGHAADRMPQFPSYWPTTDLWTLIDRHRQVTGEPGAYVDGKPSARGSMHPDVIANEAAALEFVAGLRVSFTRMVPRFVAAADDHRPEPVPADQLVTSAPLDRVWAGILTDRAIVRHMPPTGAAGEQATPTGPGVFRGGVRPVTFEWMGSRDPKLWNVVHAIEPADATTEEVAAAIYQYPGSDAIHSHQAHAIVDAAPFFVLPRSWAKDLPDAARYATAEHSSALGEPTDAILSAATFDDAALTQGADEDAHPLAHRGKASQADSARLVATLSRTGEQLDFIAEIIGPWELAPQVTAARAWVAQRMGALIGEAPATVARWAPVIEAQSRTVTEASGAMADLVSLAQRGGVAPRSPDAAPFRQALGAYAAALTTSHLADVARARLHAAHAARDQLALGFAQAALAEAGHATEDLREAEGGSFDLSTEAGTLTRERRHLQRDALALRATSLDGGGTDGTELERITIEANTVTVKARAHELAMKARHLAGALGSARSVTTMNKVAAGFDARFDTIPGRLTELAADCTAIERHISERIQVEGLALRPAATPEEQAAQVRRMLDAKRDALLTAQQDLAELPIRHGLANLNREAMNAIDDNQIAALAINVAILIAASLATSGLAAGAGGVAQASAVTRLGMTLESAAMVGTAVDVAADAAMTSLVQSAVMGGDLSDGLVENLLANAAVRASLARFAPLMAGLDDEAKAAWEADKIGKGVGIKLAKGAAIGAELITSAGVSYVAQRLAHGKQPPSDEQVSAWFIQGASMAAGRAIGARTAQLQSRMARAGARAVFDSVHGDAFANVRARIDTQISLSRAVEQSGDPDEAMRLLIENRKLLDAERDLLGHLADEPGRAEALGVSRQEVATFQHDNRAAAADLADRGMDVLPLRLAGVDELVPGALWSGTGEQIATAMFQAREVGLSVRVFDVGNEHKRWRVALGDKERVIEIQERPAPHQRGPLPKEARALLHAKAAAEIAKLRVSVVPKPGASQHYAMTPADGQRLIDLFRSLDGAEVIEYRKGVIVRHSGREWYIEFDAQAHAAAGASRAASLGAADGGIGLPESNVATVELWGYRGVRTIHGRPRAKWTAEERAEVEKATDPEQGGDKLLWAGHVGISLDGGKTIYAFTPHKPDGMTMEEFEARLRINESFPGVLGDDTAAFDRARTRAGDGWNTAPERAIIVMEKADQNIVLRDVMRMVGMQPGEHGYRYGFPLKIPDGGEAFKGTPEQPASCTRNCAAFPEKVGVPLPEPTGRMEQYMPELKKWIEADAPIDARPRGARDDAEESTP